MSRPAGGDGELGCLCGKAGTNHVCDGSAHSSGCMVNGYGCLLDKKSGWTMQVSEVAWENAHEFEISLMRENVVCDNSTENHWPIETTHLLTVVCPWCYDIIYTSKFSMYNPSIGVDSCFSLLDSC